MNALKVYNEHSIQRYCNQRDNERRIWQDISFLTPGNDLKRALQDAAQFGIKYVILGLPEDIGPRANLGSGGAELGWQAFLSRFLNLQSNRYIATQKILLLGELDFSFQLKQAEGLDASEPESLLQLRNLCSEIDDLTVPVLQDIFAAGLEPIIIGGGHNNCYPIITALHKVSEQTVNAVNLDPHADFRAIEGRHSGNGFHYAHRDGSLNDYHVLALHQYKNNEAIFDAMKQAGYSYNSYQSIFTRREISFEQACTQIRQRMNSYQNPLGIEVDVDCISNMPVSAYTNCGLSVADAEYFVHNLAQSQNTAYLHLCEAAPATHAAGVEQGLNEAGQVLSALVTSYLYSREQVIQK